MNNDNIVIQVLGKIGLKFIEEGYSETRTFKYLDWVKVDNDSYFMKKIECTGIPVTNTTYWEKFIHNPKKGTDYWTDEEIQAVVNQINSTTEAGQAAARANEAAEAAEKTTSDLTNLVNNFDSVRIEEGISQYFAMTPDYKVYTVKFPKWATSNSSQGEKLDDNVGKYLKCATDTIAEETNYGPAFDTYDVNANVDNEGLIHITAVKGMPEFEDTGKNDVFVLLRTYWEKIWEDENYWYYSRTYMPKEGYTICSQALNPDGSWRNYFLIAKYMGAKIDGTWYSSKGLAPTRKQASYNNCVNQMHVKGTYYSGTLLADIKHIMTTIWLKFATLNSQSVMAGNTSNGNQYKIALAESNVRRVVLTTGQANNIDILSCVSIGDAGENPTMDRNYDYFHNICDDVRVIDKEVVDDEHTALILDVEENFSTTETTYVSTMHERSGYSDLIKGRNGSPVSLTNGKHGNVIDGIEWSVGGYEVVGNSFMDINTENNTQRDVYICNDASLLTTNVSTAKTTYKKSQHKMTVTAVGSWQYITEIMLDFINGAAIITKSGQSGSGSSTGFADGLYFDAGTSGQREFLGFGALGNGSNAGASCVRADDGLGTAYWSILARLSIGALYQRVN